MSKITRSTSASTTIANVNTYKEIEISASYDLSKTFLTFQISSPSQAGYEEAAAISGKLYTASSKNYVRFERASSGVYTEITINYFIIQLTTATVQRGSKSMEGISSATQTITAIDASKTFLIATARSSQLSATSNEISFSAYFSNTTTIKFLRNSSVGNLYIEWQAITLSDVKSIQTFTNSISSSSTDIAITKINLAKTFIIAYFQIAAMNNNQYKQAYLSSSTNLKIVSPISSVATYYVFIVEMNYDAVYTGDMTITAGNATSGAISIGGTIVVANSIVAMGNQHGYWGNGAGTAKNAGETCVRASALTTTQITLSRGATTNTGISKWQVIEFKDAPKGLPSLIRRLETMDLKQSTSIELEIGPFLSETDFTTRQTALSLSFATHFRIKKNGDTLAAPTGSGSITHSFQGNYKFTFATGDLDTLGTLELFVDISGSTQCQRVYNVIVAAEWDRKYGSTLQNVNVTQLDGHTLASGDWELVGRRIHLSYASGPGFKAVSTNPASPGAQFIGNTTGAGISSEGGAIGNGLDAKGGATSGNGLFAQAPTSGQGIYGLGAGNYNSGIRAYSPNGDGFFTQGKASSYDISSKEIGTLLSNISTLISKLPAADQLMAGATDLEAVKTVVNGGATATNLAAAKTVIDAISTLLGTSISIDSSTTISQCIEKLAGTSFSSAADSLRQISNTKLASGIVDGSSSVLGILAKIAGTSFTSSADSLIAIETIAAAIQNKLPATDQLMAGATDLAAVKTEIDLIFPDLITIDTNIDTIVSKLPATSQSIAGQTDLAAVKTEVDKIQSIIIPDLNTITSKLPSGNISDFGLNTTVENITVSKMLSLLMAMVDGNYVINPTTGDMTIYKRDNVTPLTIVNATEISRTRGAV